MVVEKDNIVTIEYSVQDETSLFLDNNEGFTTLTFQHGSGSIVAALEKALAGMKCGDVKQVVVLPEDAYGFVDKKRIISVPNRLYKGYISLTIYSVTVCSQKHFCEQAVAPLSVLRLFITIFKLPTINYQYR
jgi:FKBP-type peptidyl-prolyl cis-trans isomerase